MIFRKLFFCFIVTAGFMVEPKAFHPPIIVTFKGNVNIEIPFPSEQNCVGFNIIKQNEKYNDAVYNNDDESQYFHHFFKKHCLCTPGEYRDMISSLDSLVLSS